MRHQPLMDAAARAGPKATEASPQAITSTVWSFAVLQICDIPLMASMSTSARSAIGRFSSQGLAKLSWAFANLRVRNQPLLYAIATAVQQRLGEFQLQSLTKIAWSSVVLLVEPRQLYPMLETTLSVVKRQPADMSSPSAHALLWCLWTTAFPQHPGRLFKEWLQRGIDLGDMSTAVEVLLADSEWRRDQDEDLTWICLLQHTSRPGSCQEVIRKYSCGRELPAWFRVQDGPWSKSKVSKNKPELAKYMQRFSNLEKFAQPASGNHWEKLGAVIDFVEHRLSAAAPQVPGTVNEMLRLLDTFAQRREHWLKVAGGAKAEVLLHTHGLRTWRWHEVAVECGTFIGYSAMRLALQMLAGRDSPDRAGPHVFTIEVDPVQACIARHLVDLAGVSCSVEVAIGQVRDIVPKIVELFGATSVGMVFMDYKGTAFHSDLDILEDTGAIGIDSRLLADNVALPGAPLLLWNLAFSPPGCDGVPRTQHRGLDGPGQVPWPSRAGTCCTSELAAPLLAHGSHAPQSLRSPTYRRRHV